MVLLDDLCRQSFLGSLNRPEHQAELESGGFGLWKPGRGHRSAGASLPTPAGSRLVGQVALAEELVVVVDRLAAESEEWLSAAVHHMADTKALEGTVAEEAVVDTGRSA